MWQCINLCKAWGINTFTATEAVKYVLLPGEWEGYIWLLSHINNKHHHFSSSDLNMFFGNCLNNFSCHYKAWYKYSTRRHLRPGFIPCRIGLALKEYVCVTLKFWHKSRPLNSWQSDLPRTEANGLKNLKQTWQVTCLHRKARSIFSKNPGSKIGFCSSFLQVLSSMVQLFHFIEE